MNRSNKIGYAVFGFLTILVLFSLFSMIAWADSDYPYGVRGINYISSSRSNVSAYSPASIDAEAGNVTELTLTAISTTKTWQGYYGNITGVVTLEDAYGYVFYNWSSLEPKGEIYAAINSSVNWSNIYCFNWTGDPTITLEGEEARLRIPDDAPDGINETFTQSGLDKNYFVGSRNITEVSTALNYTCMSTNTYRYLNGVPSEQEDDDFENSLLTDGAGALVFVTVLENNDVDNLTDITGFDNATHDFQLLVLEDGRDGHEDILTNYYFWAEIE